MGYVPISSDSDSFANRLSSSSYVDPPSFSLQLTPDTHHSESVPRSVPDSVSDDGRPTAAVHGPQVFIVSGNLRLQLLQPKVAHYYVFGKCVSGRPGRTLFGNAF